jgi:hypothetical protein
MLAAQSRSLRQWLADTASPIVKGIADHIEYQIDAADILQGIVPEVDEFICTEVERLVAVGARPVPMT